MPSFGTTDLQYYQFTFYHIPGPSRESSGFLKLPIELRQKIYHQLGFCTNRNRKVSTTRFSADDLPVRTFYHFTSSDGKHTQRKVQRPMRPFVPGDGVSTAVMRVCKQVSDETYELLYSESHIGIGWDLVRERGWDAQGCPRFVNKPL